MQPDTRNKDLWKIVIGAIGVVYGDIGTSPLYAIKESFSPGHGLALVPENIFGIISLVFWSLILVVSIKYLGFILNAANRGEGGIAALLALLIPRSKKFQILKHPKPVIVLGLFGAGLLYGDGIITPAISVLSAVEGLRIATPAFGPFVLPLTVAILVLLFSVQSRVSSRIGSIFGPVMVLWFVVLAATGLPWIFRRPEILLAFDPRFAIDFFIRNGKLGFFALSSVVLCIAGAEALYADMGNFGKRPIRIGWLYVALPALLINYFGQGALVLERGQEVVDNTFYGLVSGWMLYPLIGIAIFATVIASQAVITGAFSLSQQILQLGYSPRLTIRHTSRAAEGQIYVPKVNWFLGIACISLVLIFESSSNLAAAYGIAVTGTMAITSILFFFVCRNIWKWRLLPSAMLLIVFLTVDLAFVSANFLKVLQGGWGPILVATLALILMTTWKRGRTELAELFMRSARPLEEFIAQIRTEAPIRVSGMAIFMTLSRNVAPAPLLHHYRHNQSLHERVMLLSIIASDEPEVLPAKRVRLVHFSAGFLKVVAMYGYMESPNIMEILKACEGEGLLIDYSKISFYLGRETLLCAQVTDMPAWRKKLFILMSKNARPAGEFFGLPPDQVIEIGMQLRI
ncbi:MAG: potassium transporter Kup [Bdellovibrionales bacterium GWC1_52_8]|nr:MAG: potassium transporter Kup [Bdellovibrionales bacterium GWC1_52_8]